MAADVHYFSPTTPGAASFDEDISDFVRLGRIGPLSGDAQMGAVGTGSTILDDIDSTVGHSADGILGLKQFYWNETTCPAGNQRVFTGYTFDRKYTRGNSLVTGDARLIDVTVMDPNAFLSFRVFAPEDTDPTSSFVRPAEGTLARITALLAVDFLSTTLFDLGYIPVTGGKDLDAHDYTGSKPFEVLNDIAQVNGWNYWVGYDETENKLFLWMDDWTTDGSATLAYDSTLKLTNVESEKSSTQLLVEKWPVETVDPSRVISAVWVMGKGKKVYRTRPETAYVFGWRDAVMEAQFLSDETKLEELGDRYLLDNATEDHKISVSVQVPATQVTLIHEGMRIEAHFTHCPSVAAGFAWCRILHRTVRRDQETSEFYWLDLDLSPMPIGVGGLVAFLTGSMNATPLESLLSSGPVVGRLTAYTEGQIISGEGTQPGHTYECTVAGTTAASEPIWPTDGSTVADGTVTWQDLGSIWTRRYWSDDISNVLQFPGPGDQQWMGIYTRAPRANETVDVLTVERTSGSAGFTGAWVYELSGLGTGLTVVSGNDTILPTSGSGNITPTNTATAHITATSTVDSVLFGGYALQKVSYGEGSVLTATDGTELVNANTKNAVPSCSVQDARPPWGWAGYDTGTGALSIGATITSSGANGCANGYNLMGRGYAALLIPLDGTFSIVQSAHNSDDPIQNVVFAAPPTP